MKRSVAPLVAAAVAAASMGLNVPAAHAAPIAGMDPAFQSCLNTTYLGQTATAPIQDTQLQGLTGRVDCPGMAIKYYHSTRSVTCRHSEG